MSQRDEMPSAPILDLHQLEESCLGDTRLRRALAQAFRDDVRPALDRLEDAIAAGDMRTVEFDAHRLKGLCGVIGAARCAALFGALESGARARGLADAADLLRALYLEVGRAEGLIAPILDAA